MVEVEEEQRVLMEIMEAPPLVKDHNISNKLVNKVLLFNVLVVGIKLLLDKTVAFTTEGVLRITGGDGVRRQGTRAYHKVVLVEMVD